ncbi:hypothetical protein [Cupriavidus metallidurans]|uniref:hypothetical protein n=1 Tax=Cupriavidus metallidurans TaxID=119219 RepID=UPI0004933299|nr:hypothetical protein [Cupriavidus metallidurans]
MSFVDLEEAEDYYADRIAVRQHEVDECEQALGSLNVAHDYLEEVINARDSGDMLPSSSSRSVEDLVERQLLISDRIGLREEMKTVAEYSIEGLEEELDSIRDDFAQREAEGEDDDELEDFDG